MLEDAAGNAAATHAHQLRRASHRQPRHALARAGERPRLADRHLFNLVPISRGKTVSTETLGSGNPLVAGQDFTLAQSPVTYFFDPASISGNNFSSTVSVSVNGVQWQEVQSFYGQPKNAQVFVLHEDDQGQTHVTFGDGVNGSLLPTGTNNVIATYRYGAGAAAPRARDADRGADADAGPEGRAQSAAAHRRGRRRPAGAAALAGAAVGADLQPRRLARRLRGDRAHRGRRDPGGRQLRLRPAGAAARW